MKEYKPSILFKNGHINTIFPTYFRKVEVNYERERINLENKDFLDFDWIKNNNNKLLILCHGLEGSSKSHYIKAFARYFSERNWDILALNYRSCSGEINTSPSYYVSGKGDEIDIALSLSTKYKKIVLTGFSLGANKVLHYMGNTENKTENLKGAFVVSPPCDLYGSSIMMNRGLNKIYANFFLKQLKEKVIKKQEKYPEIFKNTNISMDKVLGAKTLIEFDDEFTAKINGCKDAFEYYTKNSSIYSLDKIDRPCHILTALDDPMMSETCYPVEAVKKNKNLSLEMPKFGGHISYASLSKEYWLEKYAYEYIETKILNKKS